MSHTEGSTVLNITAKAGHPAVLPCSCPQDFSPFFVWQKDNVVVNLHGNNDGETQTAHQFENRTHVNIQSGNCSIVFNTVRLSDEGLYTCYYSKIPLRKEEIHLKVTGELPVLCCPDAERVTHGTVMTSSVCGFLTVAIVIAAVFVGIMFRRRQRKSKSF
ncbi:hypothetical protein E1301_Tti023680 [Triplophysa tibetana]|uniref:Ig-like domain-containing protein n=1 Tax=Triplophysa tibetana TaxID=1572043 RepID=A0A5A9PNL1_9TELE|nr:hypothetical protein E1301_Tti015112 [Triplophysa tibetana]KAA0722741.1 hypothetical protein E1301_Tti023680 [Triplophysa tibetana]